MNFANDGLDYGFEMKIDDVPVGIYPFSYENGQLTQYTYDPSNNSNKYFFPTRIIRLCYDLSKC